MNILITLVIFILVIGVIVLVHEFGHFLAAKLSGVPVNEFAIGFGPKLFQRKYKGTNYAINLLPLGGYVQLEGEQASSGPGSFRDKRFRVKAFILLAGIVMNFLFAVVLLTIYLYSNSFKFAIPNFTSFNFSNVESAKSYFRVMVVNVDETGPSKDQLFVGDNVVSVGGKYFQTYEEFQQILRSNQNSEQDFEFLNLDDFSTTIRKIKIASAPEDQPLLKVGLVFDKEFNRPAYFIRYNKSITSGFSMSYDLFIYQAKALGSIIVNSFSTGNYTELADSVGGLPKVGEQVNQVVQFGSYDILIPLVAVLSLSLAFFNVLPFPALDGGQLFFAAIERATRRKIPDAILERINLVGFVFLMGLGILVTIKDIVQLQWINSLLDIFRGFLGR